MPTDSSPLGQALARHNAGDLAAAEPLYRQVLVADPGCIVALINLGICLRRRGQIAEAVACYQKVLAIRPEHVDARNAMGIAYLNDGQLDEALACFRQIIEIRKDHVEAHTNAGIALRSKGELEEAARFLQSAVLLGPTARSHYELGVTLVALNRTLEAEACYATAAKMQPDYIEAQIGLAALVRSQQRFEEALAIAENAVRIQPNAMAYNLLGNLHLDAGPFDGRVERALACLRKACELEPQNAWFHSNLLFNSHYSPDATPESFYQAHCQWAARFEDPKPQLVWRSATVQLVEPRRLRVGYMSPHLRDNPTSWNVGGVLGSHDHSRFEIFGYSNMKGADAVTERIRGYMDHWREISGLSDQAVADLIRADKIDVLVDLAGHMRGGRPLLLGRCPAPVQVSYLVYPDTLGMKSVQYRITDALADPPGTADRFYSEKLVRLPEGACSYCPGETPPVNGLPSSSGRAITFGAFNRLMKTSPQVVKTWSEILKAVPGSRLAMLNNRADDQNPQLLDIFARNGIGNERLQLVGLRPRNQYLMLYHDVDVALDPFPYNGCATTGDALWMGVPVITLAGDTDVSRQGVRMLVPMGLADMIASTQEDYVQKAVHLANDRERLVAIRSGARATLQASILGDYRRMTRHLEQAYESMYAECCGACIRNK